MADACQHMSRHSSVGARPAIWPFAIAEDGAAPEIVLHSVLAYSRLRHHHTLQVPDKRLAHRPLGLPPVSSSLSECP
jgi:hypothetical protein